MKRAPRGGWCFLMENLHMFLEPEDMDKFMEPEKATEMKRKRQEALRGQDDGIPEVISKVKVN
jgi:hypothetical protein